MTILAPKRWLPAYQWLAGMCDALTGALLLVAPVWTLKLMGVHQPPQPVEFVSFVGAFVFSVGLAYLYAARIPLTPNGAHRWQTVWVLTALSRSMVAAFLLWHILAGKMEPAWLVVAASDAALAILQWIGLGRGWLDFKD